MFRHRCFGITLIEVLVVVTLVAMVLTVVISLGFRTAEVFARNQPRTETHQTLMVGIQQVQHEVREAMFIRLGSSATAMEIALPLRDASGANVLQPTTLNSTPPTQVLVRTEGMHVCFFLGRVSPTNPAVAIPDATNGDTLFRIATGTTTTVGTDIISDTGTLASSYTNATTIISGILSTPMVPSPTTPGQEVAATIFSYTGTGSASFSPDGSNAQVARITLAMPVKAPNGTVFENMALTSEFCLRNFETL